MIPTPSVFTIIQTVLVVGGDGGAFTIQEAVDRAAPYDTVRIEAGVYREHVEIRKPVVLDGKPGAVLDGDGQGRIVQAFVPVTIRGLTLRNSGRDLSQEHAAIWITDADDVRVEHNVIEDALFGIYIKQSKRAAVIGNRITGKMLEPGRRGDGIRFWYSPNGLIADNDVRRVRDVVVWFSDSTVVERNTVTDSRYGLHYMYSNANRFVDNRFERNEVGAFLMYSRDILFERNTFAYALGAFGKGLGFKDTENVRARSNLIVKNSIGIFLDNSPLSRGVVNQFENNVLAFNEVGVSLLPSVKNNQFIENTFQGNVQVADVTGGGSALANTFRRNYWSGYAGFDQDGDGIGDTPYTLDRVTDDLLSEEETLQLFRLSTAAFTLDALGRLMPVLKPTPLLADSAPSIRPRGLTWAAADSPSRTPRVAGVAITGLAVLGLGLIVRHRRAEP